MKKLLCLIFTFVLCLSVTACAHPAEKLGEAAAPPEGVFSENSFTEILTDFIGTGANDRSDRTCFGEGEKKASEYIAEQLLSYGFAEGESMEVQEFSAEVTNRYGTESEKLYSQNVIATYNAGKEKLVVVGAHYDNLKSSITQISSVGTESDGVMNNATGVGVLLALAQAFKQNSPELDFTVQFVFFGASEVGVVGSNRYVTEKVADVNNILLMVNIDSVASDTVNVYSDETETVEGDLFVKNGEKYGTAFKPMQHSVPIFPQQYADNLDYTHIGQLSDHVSFFERNVPVVNLFGTDIDSFEYAADDNDTLETFKANYPSYGKAMADVASLVYGTLTDSGFVSVAASFRSEKYDYSFYTGGYWATVVYIGLIIILAVILIFVVKHFEKKYPFRPVIKKLKIAVFGMEYEQNTDNDIYIDLKQAGDTNDDGNEIDPFN